MKNTSLCYLESEGKYLMLHRISKQNDENAGKWIGIGGKFEEGESPEECVRREVKEETGLTLDRASFRGIVTFTDSNEKGITTEYMFLFTSSDFSGTLTPCNEGVLEWIPKSEIHKLPLWEGDHVFLNLLEAGSPFFSLKLCYSNGSLCEVYLNGSKQQNL